MPSKMQTKMPTKTLAHAKAKGAAKRKPAPARSAKISTKPFKGTNKPTAIKKKLSKKITAKARALTSANKSLKSFSIVETSPTTWSVRANGPTFEQVQLAAYHRWLQSGGSDTDNWFSAEGNLRGQKDS